MPPTPDLGNIDLANFTIGSMLRTGVALRRDLREIESLEQAAQVAVRYFHSHCVQPDTGEGACALVRFYKTHQYKDLDPDLKRLANRQLKDMPVRPSMRCLVLLGTAGDEPAWNARQHSQGHQIIALPDADVVRKAPMILRLIEGIGLDVDAVVRGSPEQERSDARTYDVFHVEDALGSPHIPAQTDFVVPYGIRSVVGVGGLLRSGELFAVILFSKVHISGAGAARFRTIALDLRSAFYQIDEANTWIASPHSV